MKKILALLLVTLLGVPALATAADRHLLWEVRGPHATVWLLGSVHVLKPDEAPLPPAADRAYDAAQRLVMEVDLDAADADPMALMGQMQSAALLPQGRTLRDVLAPDYDAIDRQARAAGLDLSALEGYAPWLAALTVLDLELARRGYSPEYGIEQTLARRAARDGKPIEGLETAAEQFAMLASMPLPMQKRFLQMTLDESADLDQELEDLLQAWRSGDTVALAHMLEQESQEFPDLYRRLTVDRNRAWAGKIDGMLRGDDDCLVIVGAMHLVGPESVVDLLRRRGYTVTQR
ncbi:MAG: TraB/GumN family protein [Steroidobacteraceae bacterium]